MGGSNRVLVAGPRSGPVEQAPLGQDPRGCVDTHLRPRPVCIEPCGRKRGCILSGRWQVAQQSCQLLVLAACAKCDFPGVQAGWNADGSFLQS